MILWVRASIHTPPRNCGTESMQQIHRIIITSYSLSSCSSSRLYDESCHHSQRMEMGQFISASWSSPSSSPSSLLQLLSLLWFLESVTIWLSATVYMVRSVACVRHVCWCVHIFALPFLLFFLCFSLLPLSAGLVIVGASAHLTRSIGVYYFSSPQSFSQLCIDLTRREREIERGQQTAFIREISFLTRVPYTVHTSSE